MVEIDSPEFAEIVDSFEFLDDWEDRYRYIIELGRELPPLGPTDRVDANKVDGCVSQVWLVPRVERNGDDARLYFEGDSDAHITRGLIAILRALYSGRTFRGSMWLGRWAGWILPLISAGSEAMGCRRW